ncbi:MAG: hypothetical protein HY421_01975 [Candidatus Kerfeldbacteria bacterium]|nr:hypothetical protein [Candidatus Kerfeldbacteria bacterium]
MYRHRVSVAVVALAAAIGWMRSAVPAESGQVTPGAVQKLTVYSGVLMIVPNATDSFEFGNAGRDIASTFDINLRPDRTLPGSRFYKEPGIDGRCSIAVGTACNANSDCPSGQACIGSQSLELTGDLIVATGKNLCFPGNDCRVDWPASGGTAYWATNAGAVSPKAHAPPYEVRVGQSNGLCPVDGTSCQTLVDCNQDDGPQPCLPVTGLGGKHAVSVTSNTAQPALQAYGTVNFGQRDQSNAPLNNGNVFVTGALIVQHRGLYKNLTSGFPSTARVWYRDVYDYFTTDTQDGSGLDADTLDGSVPVNFKNNLTPNDLSWLSWYAPNAGAYPPLAYGDGGWKVRTVLCATTERTKVCATGPDAGKACNANGDCGTPDQFGNPVLCTKVCKAEEKMCQLDNIYHCRFERNKVCHEQSDCNPAIGPFNSFQNFCERDELYGFKQCTHFTSYRLVGPTVQSCNSDADCTTAPFNFCVPSINNTKACASQPAQACTTDSECPFREYCAGFHCSQDASIKCQQDSDCSGSGTCVQGDVFNNAWCGGVYDNTNCENNCRTTVKKDCDGDGAVAECNSKGTGIGYNKGTCTTANDCRCSTNIQGIGELPYIDVKSQPGGGQICTPLNCIGCDQGPMSPWVP